MRNFVVGFLLGIVVATIGFSGLAAWLDRGVNQIKEVVQK